MLVYSYISFIAAIIYLFFGFFLLRFNVRLRINQIFLLMTTSFAIWSFGYSMIYVNWIKDSLFFWYRVSSIGWIFAATFLLHFILLFTKKSSIPFWRNLLILFYLIGVVFLYRSFYGTLYAQDFLWQGSYWQESIDSRSFWLWGYLIFLTIELCISHYLIFNYMRKEKSKRIKKQSLWIFLSVLISVVFSYSLNVGGLLAQFSFPVLGHIAFLFGVAGIAFAFNRYKLMNITYPYITDQILANLQDFLFVIDLDHNIFLTNNQAKAALDFSTNELHGRDIRCFMNINPKDSLRLSKSSFNYLSEFSNLDGFIVTDKGIKVPVNISSSAIFDEFSDQIGSVIVGHDIREKNELAKKNALIEEELKLAQKVQDSMIPSAPKNILGLNVACYYKPMDLLGGDFYNFSQHRESQDLGIIIGDVSGHGVPAALITGMFASNFDAARAFRDEPAELLRFLNKSIYGMIGGNFITAFYSIIDPLKKEIRFARAGHPYPLLLRQNVVHELYASGTALGIHPEISLTENNLDLRTEDKIIFFTDGVVEAENDKKMTFETLLMQKLPQWSHFNAQDLMDKISQELTSFVGDRAPADDIAIVVVEIL